MKEIENQTIRIPKKTHSKLYCCWRDRVYLLIFNAFPANYQASPRTTDTKTNVLKKDYIKIWLFFDDQVIETL